jgi:hypothetical protein
MGCEPGINTSIVKGMGAIIQNAHVLTLLDGILTDGTIVVHATRGSDKGSIMMNLIRSRMDGNGLIEKVMKRGGFKHLPNDIGKKGVCRGISS